MEKLTPRQWWLYRYLEAQSEIDPDRWISDQEVIDACNCDFLYQGERYEFRKSANTHDHCSSLRADIEAINASPRVSKMILYKNYLMKFPSGRTKEEAIEEAKREYLDDMRARAMRLLTRYGIALRKARSHGQGKLLNCDGNALQDGNEPFVEALVIKEACEDILL